MKAKKVKSKENVAVGENLKNHKRWFNGMKEFSSVKVEPVQINPPDLGIHITDIVDTADLFGKK